MKRGINRYRPMSEVIKDAETQCACNNGMGTNEEWERKQEGEKNGKSSI